MHAWAWGCVINSGLQRRAALYESNEFNNEWIYAMDALPHVFMLTLPLSTHVQPEH
jgi:hypothetical protein